MKKTILTLCMVFALMGMGTGRAADTKPADSWTTDWSAFVNQLSIEVTNDNVNTAFSNKSVTWVGKVKAIEKPTKSKPGSIGIAMKPETLKSGRLDKTLDFLLLKPENTEWLSWNAVSVGDVVKFRTMLVREAPLLPGNPESVLAFVAFTREGEEPTTFLAINTKGGKCLSINPKSRK